MNFFNNITTWQIISGILVVLLYFSISYIKKLKKRVEAERQKRLVPFLDVEIDEDKTVFSLTNNSHCCAKNIHIDDLTFLAKVGFEKHLTLKFEEIDMLKPSQKTILVFKVFDDGQDITDSNSRNLIHHLKGSGICLQIQCTNFDNTPFISTIEERNQKFIIKEVTAVDFSSA